MGGDHGHGHHVKVPRVPDYKIYKVDTIPELMATQQALAKKGLKDPWLRNEVWKFDLEKRGGTNMQIMYRTFGRGFFLGLGLAIVTAGIQKVYERNQPHHGHEENHSHH